MLGGISAPQFCGVLNEAIGFSGDVGTRLGGGGGAAVIFSRAGDFLRCRLRRHVIAGDAAIFVDERDRFLVAASAFVSAAGAGAGGRLAARGGRGGAGDN